MIPVTVNSGPLKDTVSIALCFHTPLKSYFISTCAQVRQKKPIPESKLLVYVYQEGETLLFQFHRFTEVNKQMSTWIPVSSGSAWQRWYALSSFSPWKYFGVFCFCLCLVFLPGFTPNFQGIFFFFFRKSHFHEELLFILVLNTRMGFYLK